MSMFWIAAGAAVGAIVRHALTRGQHPGAGLLAANVGGALVLGIMVFQGFGSQHPSAYLTLGTGFCGTLTTMSGLTLAASERRHGVGILTAHLVLGVAAAASVSGAVALLYAIGNAGG